VAAEPLHHVNSMAQKGRKLAVKSHQFKNGDMCLMIMYRWVEDGKILETTRDRSQWRCALWITLSLGSHTIDCALLSPKAKQCFRSQRSQALEANLLLILFERISPRQD
ncbi:unnamed protein product, partial [Musa hybrid cultivar]